MLSPALSPSRRHHPTMHWPHRRRATGLRSHRHYTAPGTAALALRRSCPTHWATGRLDSPVAIPHTLGNWYTCCCRLSSDRAHDQAYSSSQATSGNHRMRLAHAPLHLYRPEQTVLFRAPQTLPSGLSNTTMANPTSLLNYSTDCP
jgi:hypothetical protein